MIKKASILLLSLLAGVSLTAQAADWGYGNSTEHWSDSYPTCGLGKNQSPINITSALKANLAPLNIEYNGKITDITNNGHTIEAHVSGDNKLIVDGDTYTLKQFHFHTPSENYIDGKQYPLEAHFVNVDDKGNIAVVAVMFENGLRANSALSTLLKQIPTKGKTIDFTDDLSPDNLLPREREYYQFNGSLTTPPCTEGVRWFVLETPQYSSKDQTEQLHQIMGDNNRPVQPINARIIVE
ncbi:MULTISPECIES: carbonic anhydrase family protein [unclassified Photobacterium]|uniref:carbonic anhydrase n=1 Tax=unclassified Photobacterium TaxID=2628852 RepID=UPI001EDDBF61|nr:MULTISPECIES: carbonic anhydrase family protein [unclassified Photobacterium]MCG3865078.1 carbonic anhydrase family protein [Photobacterium sp. Ph6]MCG3876446.1 carbonic anhydrase family protein [Photobacterium sp. Ph5]